VLPDLAESNLYAYNICENLIIYSLPLVLLVISFLMVSRIRYPHIVNQYIKGRKPFANLIGCMLLVGLFLWFRQIVLAVGFCGFALSGLLKWLYGIISRKNLGIAIADSAESDLTGVDRANITNPPAGNTQQPFTPA
jgi:phosphatidylserine synthase